MQRALMSTTIGRAGQADAEKITRLLRASLDGAGPAVAPLAAGRPAPPHAATTVPEPVTLVVRTSGSTGEPRAVMLDGEALLASARATHDRLGGAGRWVLALPLVHIAGLQVLVRSLVAGTEPAVVPGDTFDPVAAAETVHAARRPGLPLYTALVPTQLHRILAHAAGGVLPPGLRAWADLDAILVGGAAAAPDLLGRARDAGLRVVTTYGMTETSGGCVYDGVPLTGVTVRTDALDGVNGTGGVNGTVGTLGTVHVAGPVLARGYLDRPDADEAFETRDGVRWLRTGDLGELVDGVLRIHGRTDDVIITGGVKVAPTAVETELARVAGVGQVCVVGVPDQEWGQLVTAVVVPTRGGPPPDLTTLARAVAQTLGDAAVPRRLVLVDALAERGPGKVDRAAVIRAVVRADRP